MGYYRTAFCHCFVILMPILIYKKDLAFLWTKEFILALIGGVGYCLTSYTLSLCPAAHAAIF
jgi:hypothetical protein